MTNYYHLVLAAWGVIAVGGLQERVRRVTHSGEEKAQFEATCVRNIPVIRSARTDAAGRDALQSLASCPDTGAALVAERWRSRPTDTVYINMLQQVSRNINDERIADAAIEIVEDRGEREDLRRRAVETIATQISPNFYVRVGPMKPMPGSTARILSSLDLGSPGFFLAGRREIGPQSQSSYEQRLLAVADEDTALASDIRTILKWAREARQFR
jgi:hypothetical protein